MGLTCVRLLTPTSQHASRHVQAVVVVVVVVVVLRCSLLTLRYGALCRTKRPGMFEHHRAKRLMWPADAEAAPNFFLVEEDLAEITASRL